MSGVRAATMALLVLGVAAAAAAGTYDARANESEGDQRIVMRDDCDANDPGWDAVGGCTRKRGNVTFAEFLGELDSPLAAAVIGHQSWRNDPSYLVITTGQTVRVPNAGGREHTFTEVVSFGGGKAPPLNEGLVVAPECPGSTDIEPGESTTVSGLTVGNHRFQCCIHPWMRALIKVQPHAGEDNEG